MLKSCFMEFHLHIFGPIESIPVSEITPEAALVAGEQKCQHSSVLSFPVWFHDLRKFQFLPLLLFHTPPTTISALWC